MENNNLPPLTMPPEEMRRISAMVSELIVNHFENLKNSHVTRPSNMSTLDAGLREPLPLKPTSFDKLLEQLKTHVFDEMTHLDHPRNFAFVPGPSNFISAMADSISSALNVFCGAWLGPSGVAQIELTTIEWLRQLMGLPKEAGGLFISGGSMANMTCLAVARHVMLANNTTNATIYFSDQTHSSVAKGLKILGFQQFQIRKIQSDENFRLPLDALRQRIAADRMQGMVPFCVVANAGTTNAGAVDPLPELSAFCKAEGLWLHVDGAYGGVSFITERGKAALKGIDLADSIGIDPHKWFFQPYEIGCALVRNRQHLGDTFKVSAEYLKILAHSAEQINFSDYGVQLTRGFRALKLWLSLKTFGVDEFKRAINMGIENAEYVQKLINADKCWDVITPAQLGIITFRYTAPGLDEEQLNDLNNKIANDMMYSGFALISPTILGGKHVLRICAINPRATHEDLEKTIAMLKDFGENSA